MQTDINYYVTRDGINNSSFRQNLNAISKNIFRRQNPLELVFEDISTFDSENPVVVSLLKELDIGKQDVAGDLIKKAPRQRGLDFVIQNRLSKLKEGNENINNSNNLSPPPSPPPPPPSFLTPQPPPPSPQLPFHSSERYLPPQPLRPPSPSPFHSLQ